MEIIDVKMNLKKRTLEWELMFGRKWEEFN